MEEISAVPRGTPKHGITTQAFWHTLRAEYQALGRYLERVVYADVKSVLECLNACRGRIVVLGVGKSGIVGQKLAATFSSTGSPAFYLSASECAHGDLGAIVGQDVCLALSNSGESQELIALLPYFEQHNIGLLSIVGRSDSTLAQASSACIRLGVVPEADSDGIVPTCSTTLMLAVGDALAMALKVAKGVKSQQFAMWHPGGNLGKKLCTRVKHLMHGVKNCPLVSAHTPLKEVLVLMNQFRLGCLVSEMMPRRYAIFTDGDLRRTLSEGEFDIEKSLSTVFHKSPLSIDEDCLAQEALEKMESAKITQLLVLNNRQVYVGVLHIHDVLEFQDQ